MYSTTCFAFDWLTVKSSQGCRPGLSSYAPLGPKELRAGVRVFSPELVIHIDPGLLLGGFQHGIGDALGDGSVIEAGNCGTVFDDG